MFHSSMEYDMVIRRVSSFLNFQDLKAMRLVSKKWHRILSSQEKFDENRCTVITASSLVNKDLENWFNKALAIPWREVYLKNFYAIERGNFVKYLWPSMSGNVTKLVLSTVKIACGDTCTILNSAPGLTQVTFQNVKFNPTFDCTRGQPPVQTFIYCSHLEEVRDVEEYDRLTRANVPSPTITILKIEKQDSFPICVMENLIKRSSGTLIDFSIRESPTPPIHFDLVPRFARPRRILPTFIPTWDQIRPQILQLIRTSSTTLKRLDFYKCGFGLYEFLDNNFQNNELQIEDLVLGTRLDNLFVDRQANLRAGNLMIGLANYFPNFLQSISLTIAYHEGTQNALQNALMFLSNLKNLQIGIIVSTQRPFVPIVIIIPRALTLKEFVVCHRPSTPSRTLMNEFLNYEFLENMDTTSLQSLTLNTNRFHIRDRIDPGSVNVASVMINMFGNGELRQLKKLCFWKGFTVTNCLLQTIIANLPQLEELSVRLAEGLCDAGIVGLRQARETCPHCGKNSRLPAGHMIDGLGHRISALTELKLLNLYDCRCITDISLNAFAFPKLMEINLALCSRITNAGLLALAQNNPNLETVVLDRNPLITFQGIREFLTRSRSIKNIFMKDEPKLEPLDPQYHGIIKLNAVEKIASAPLGMGLEDMINI